MVLIQCDFLPIEESFVNPVLQSLRNAALAFIITW